MRELMRASDPILAYHLLPALSGDEPMLFDSRVATLQRRTLENPFFGAGSCSPLSASKPLSFRGRSYIFLCIVCPYTQLLGLLYRSGDFASRIPCKGTVQ